MPLRGIVLEDTIVRTVLYFRDNGLKTHFGKRLNYKMVRKISVGKDIGGFNK